MCRLRSNARPQSILTPKLKRDRLPSPRGFEIASQPICQLAVTALLLVGLAHATFAQGLPPGTIHARSASGQFMIYSLPSAPQDWIGNFETNQSFARLAPTLLPVSCERIKQILWRTLGETGPWRGRICVVMRPARSTDDMVTITSEQFRDGWQYRIELPDFIERSRYVRGLVQALLLELANRDAIGHSAEIPAWLLEGLAQELLVSNNRDEIIPPPPRPATDGSRIPSTYTFVNARFPNPLQQAHKELSGAVPLSFQELSWPSYDQLNAPAIGLYRDSAQLFVNRLLGLKTGRSCLHAMLRDLGQHYNWQFAFLRAFSPYFQRPLDVEKWWALQAVTFTGRDLAQNWPPQESWQKLDEVIRSEVQVRVGTNDLPLRVAVSLQTMIQEWEPARQGQAFEDKLHELELLRPRVAPGLIPLIDEYHRVLSSYLQGQKNRKKAPSHQLVTQTLMELSALDFQRASLKPPRSRANPDAPGTKVTSVP
jgi:hypothetical protein